MGVLVGDFRGGGAEEVCDELRLALEVLGTFAELFGFLGVFFLGLAAGKRERTRGFFGVSFGERKLSRLAWESLRLLALPGVEQEGSYLTDEGPSL